MSFKHLFARSLAAAPGRLHMAAHSHHLWPDASFDGQVECWEDAARLADRKWDRVMGELWPEAQREVAEELGTGQPDAVVFAGNTHDFLVRLWAAAPRRADAPLRVLTTDGEFHSARRQFARWVENGDISLTVLPSDPVDTLAERLAGQAGEADMILVSQILFGSGRLVRGLEQLAALAAPEGPWIVIDGYHSLMATPLPLGRVAPPSPLPLAGGAGGGPVANGVGRGPVARSSTLADRCFFLAGGYKYAMSGEGLGLMHCPPGFGPRPPITGWYAEFEDLTAPPGQVGYAPDAMRFMGATFDPSALYRFLHVRRALAAEDLDTATISTRTDRLKAELLEALEGTKLSEAELLNPPAGQPAARFLALRHPSAADWQQQLMARDCITDVRGDVLRVGLGLYHDQEDVERFAGLAEALD